MNINLTNHQRKILANLYTNDSGRNQSAFDNLHNGKLSFDDIEILCGIINEEYMMKGILPNFEPNEYGIELENLIDVINQPRTKKI